MVAVSWIVDLANVLRTWTFEVNVSSSCLELRSLMRRRKLVLTDLRSLELNKDGSLRLGHTRGALYARTVPQVDELLAILTAANPTIQVRRE